MKKTKYYFKQAFYNIKRSYLYIIGLILALSLVAGIDFYVGSLQDYMFQDSNPNFSDITITSAFPLENQLSLNQDTFELIQNSCEKSNISPESITKYEFLHFGRGIFNISNNEPFTFPDFWNFNSDFYQSSAATNQFEIKTGRFPENSNEILVSTEFADRFNSQLEDSLTFQLNYVNSFEYSELDDLTGVTTSVARSTGYIGPNYIFKLASFRISGIFEPNTEHGFFLGNHFSVSYGDRYYFLGMRDFDLNQTANPLHNLYEEIHQNSTTSHIAEDYITHDSGYSISIDKSHFDSNRILAEIERLQDQIYLMKSDLDNHLDNQIVVDDFITVSLQESYDQIQVMRYSLQLVNIPIILFSILIGYFLLTTNLNNRMSELLLLKTRGMSTKMFKKQIYVESVLNSLVATSFSIPCGILFIGLFHRMLSPLLFTNPESIYLTPIFSWNVIGSTLAISQFISLLSTFFVLKKNKFLNTSDVLKQLGKSYLESEYDEITLFASKSMDKNSTKNNPYPDSKKSTSLYKNVIDIAERKTKRKGYIYLFLGLILLFLFPLSRIVANLSLNDELNVVHEAFSMASTYLSWWVSIIPILFCVGFWRIFIFDSPSKFARWTKKISSLLLKSKSHLAGLQIIKNHRFTHIVLLIGITTSLFSYYNGYMISSYQYATNIEDIKIGSDVRIVGVINSGIVSNHTCLSDLKQDLLKLQSEDSNSYFQDGLQLYASGYNHRRDNLREFMMARSEFHVNYSEYIRFIQDQDYAMSMKSTIKKMNSILEFNSNQANNNSGFIISNPNISPMVATDSPKSNGLYKTMYNRSSHRYESKYLGWTSEINVYFENVKNLPGISNLVSYYSSNPRDIYIHDIGQEIFNATNLIASGVMFYLQFSDTLSVNLTEIEEVIGKFLFPYMEIVSIDFKSTRGNSPVLGLNIPNLGSYSFLYNTIYMLIALVSFSFAIMMISFYKENNHIHSILLAHGYSKKEVRKLNLCQFFTVWSAGIAIGLLSGFFTLLIQLKSALSVGWGETIYYLADYRFPIYANWGEIALVLIIPFIFCIGVFLVYLYLEKRKSIIQINHVK